MSLKALFQKKKLYYIKKYFFVFFGFALEYLINLIYVPHQTKSRKTACTKNYKLNSEWKKNFQFWFDYI